LKKFSWLFQSKLHPTDILVYHSDIKELQHDLKQLQKYKADKLAMGDSDRRAKEANREIAKLEFHNLIKHNERTTHTFLTITSPPSANYSRVFHPILQEIRIENSARPFRTEELYLEVQGRVNVKREFPLEFTVELI
jgi:hypothetical protein